MKCNKKFSDEEKSMNQFLVTGTSIYNIFVHFTEKLVKALYFALTGRC